MPAIADLDTAAFDATYLVEQQIYTETMQIANSFADQQTAGSGEGAGTGSNGSDQQTAGTGTGDGTTPDNQTTPVTPQPTTSPPLPPVPRDYGPLQGYIDQLQALRAQAEQIASQVRALSDRQDFLKARQEVLGNLNSAERAKGADRDQAKLAAWQQEATQNAKESLANIGKLNDYEAQLNLTAQQMKAIQHEMNDFINGLLPPKQ